MSAKSLELYDVETETAVRIGWPAAGEREPMIRFKVAGGRAVTLPASVVQLAVAVLRDPTLLASAGRA